MTEEVTIIPASHTDPPPPNRRTALAIIGGFAALGLGASLLAGGLLNPARLDHGRRLRRRNRRVPHTARRGRRHRHLGPVHRHRTDAHGSGAARLRARQRGRG
ncbi:hypothetical protein BN11_1080033 [Nostocoides australiense Ben110]|uniref:Uncharacterized protein n=1 Tax=Nostocoides australiense Ben110 TaxID=1193182 RepID=W6JS91_9MICO|nr:hypothetical protein BN11_1080033 [Tetrasphaera australiensis Ben110]